MKVLNSIVILSLILSPIFWNGLSLVHYMVEHTHAFCLNDEDHNHQSVDECETICSLHSQDDPVPSQKIEYQEFKQYITTLSTLNIKSPFSTLAATKAVTSLHYGRIYSNDVFHPPIC